MKQLLYKVWDFEQNCWIEKSTGFGWWHLSSDGKVSLMDLDESSRKPFHVPFTPDRFDILLWTGCKDKNGEDMYDGHIGRVIIGGEESIHEIRWHGHNDYPAFDLVPHLDLECNNLSYIIQSFDGLDSSIELIGHKHTHPDLMKGDYTK